MASLLFLPAVSRLGASVRKVHCRYSYGAQVIHPPKVTFSTDSMLFPKKTEPSLANTSGSPLV